jgi:hypothetical protein
MPAWHRHHNDEHGIGQNQTLLHQLRTDGMMQAKEDTVAAWLTLPTIGGDPTAAGCISSPLPLADVCEFHSGPT